MDSKFMIGGAIIVIFTGFMIYLFTQTNIAYESDFDTIMASGKTTKATGFWVKEKHYKMDNSKNVFSFYMKDENGKEMLVLYQGSIPNNFESATSVVVTGKYTDNYFHAKDILTKCPSKYETELETRTNT